MRRAPKAALLLMALLALGAVAQAAQGVPRRAALEEDDAAPGEAQKAALAVLEADKGADAAKPKRPKREEPLPEELLRGEAVEAAMEEEIAEFEEEGGLALSIVIWLFALAAPCGVLLYLRFKTNLLGAAPPEASALLATLAGALGFGGAAAGTPGAGGAGAAGAALAAAAAAGRKADSAAQAAAPAPAAPQSKGAILRQLEEENVRLRASMSAAGAVPASPKPGGASA